MTYAEMPVGCPCIVTECAKGGPFAVGDRVRKDSYGSIINTNAGGWMDEREMKRIKRFAVEVDSELLKALIAESQRKIDKFAVEVDSELLKALTAESQRKIDKFRGWLA